MKNDFKQMIKEAQVAAFVFAMAIFMILFVN